MASLSDQVRVQQPGAKVGPLLYRWMPTDGRMQSLSLPLMRATLSSSTSVVCSASEGTSANDRVARHSRHAGRRGIDGTGPVDLSRHGLRRHRKRDDGARIGERWGRSVATLQGKTRTVVSLCVDSSTHGMPECVNGERLGAACHGARRSCERGYYTAS